MIEKNEFGKITRYSYLESGPLHEVVLSDGRRVEYTSDPAGKRISKSINGKTVEKYLWQDLTTLVAVTDAEGLRPKVFTYDEEGDPVAMTYEGKTFYFATDQVGSIFMVADERGNEVKRIIYDSFGNLLFDSNEKFDTCVGFSAGLTDKDTGLIHFGYCEYDPAIGRFITPDPIGFAGGPFFI
ncbi:RHS repeat domain-containing protein [Maridesulfovibrio ferrireducens]|uniref:RHS repeat domain-containing protein n=1 Tax=Maridesulfovibrio ferrireducens TaxID=246191 RepID=UPI001A1B580C|nr:RHS repeat-associated core domain-containing protein [Maridesulfovibrio ferrireducens]MBI9111738.1 RHS repeat-associated core domain-containing protein [Maridesulfovibrio ferrireducens]